MKKDLKEQIQAYENMLQIEGIDYMKRLLTRYTKRLDRSPTNVSYQTKVLALDIILN